MIFVGESTDVIKDTLGDGSFGRRHVSDKTILLFLIDMEVIEKIG